jgi:two-component system cell cycle sensor histidine kinase/response regulator CckA
LLVNQAFADLVGRPKEDIVGKLREEFLPKTETGAVARRQHEEVVRTGKAAESERTTDLGDGIRAILVRDTPILDSEGRVDRLVSISTDITERKRLESELRQSQKMQVVGQLAGGVAHDFNNLLTAIAAYAAMSERKLSPGHEVLALRKGILDAVDRASALIRQLLIFSRRDITSLEVVDVNRQVVGSSELLRRMIGTNIELVVTPYATPLHIEVDPSQFEQVLINFAVNARDAMPDGGKLTVALGQHTIEDYADDPLLPPGEYVKLAVSDNGTGMAIEVRDRVFEPFFTTKEIGKGTGLGLSTCFGIVKENGGDIRVESAPGAGTTCVVYLPITAKLGPVFTDLPADKDHPLGMETILLVEDESVVRDIASMALREQGYTVVEASNGEEALRAAEVNEGEIHMVLTDMVMPMMGGKELTQQVHERWPGTPVMLMSGYTGEEPLSQEIPLLNKPFIIGEMLSMVRQVLDQSGRSISSSSQQLGLWPDERQ